MEMKVGDLREILKKYKTDDLRKLVVELYKLVPKEKKEDYKVDDLILSGGKEKVKVKLTKQESCRPVKDIAAEIDLFVANAKNFCYVEPNKVVPKKERSKWRFVVKRLYKELDAAAQAGDSTREVAKQLQKLYELLTYACDWIIFNAYDVFESIGISQEDFFLSIVKLKRKSEDIDDFVYDAIRLIHFNPLNRHTLYSDLSAGLHSLCDTPDMKKMLIDQLKELYKEVEKSPDYDQSNSFGSSKPKNGLSYKRKRELNEIAEHLMQVQCLLYNFEEAIANLKKYYLDENEEIKLYVLARILFRHNEPQIVLDTINAHLHVKPRTSLLNLKAYIEEHKKLPWYF